MEPRLKNIFMSISEEEKIKVIVVTANKLNGWWRIWIVLYFIWGVVVLLKSPREWSKSGLNEEIVSSQSSIYKELDSQNKSLIFESEEQARGSKTRMASIQNHGPEIIFKLNVTEEQKIEFVTLYCNIGRSLQFQRRGFFILARIGLFVFPQIILIISYQIIAWIKEGFNRQVVENDFGSNYKNRESIWKIEIFKFPEIRKDIDFEAWFVVFILIAIVVILLRQIR